MWKCAKMSGQRLANSDTEQCDYINKWLLSSSDFRTQKEREIFDLFVVGFSSVLIAIVQYCQSIHPLKCVEAFSFLSMNDMKHHIFPEICDITITPATRVKTDIHNIQFNAIYTLTGNVEFNRFSVALLYWPNYQDVHQSPIVWY